MDTASYTTITRQSGLLAEMQSIANNIANANTTGYRAENVIFTEFLQTTGTDSLSMATAHGHETSALQGALTQTGGTFDLAIEGEGYFLIDTPDGQRLTRNGSFTPNEAGDLVTLEGFPVLDAGGSPVFVPQGTDAIGISSDGTVSANGQPVGQIGLYVPEDPLTMRRENGVKFSADSYAPVDAPQIAQGFVEESNVDTITQIARMVEVQRAYELGQSFNENEDKRIRGVIDTLGR